MKLIYIISLLVFVTFPLQGAEVGKLFVKVGQIQILRDQKATQHSPSKRGIALFQKDRIRTGYDSRGVIHFKADKSQVKLYGSSFLSLEDILPKRVNMRLKFGRAFFKVIPNRLKKFRVRTVDAVIGIKGTEFFVQTQGNLAQVATLEGLVSLSNVDRPGWTVDIPPGMISSVKKAHRPTEPVTMSEKAKKALKKLSSLMKEQKEEKQAKEAETKALKDLDDEGKEEAPQEPIALEPKTLTDTLSDLEDENSNREEDAIEVRDTQKEFKTIKIYIEDE